MDKKIFNHIKSQMEYVTDTLHVKDLSARVFDDDGGLTVTISGPDLIEVDVHFDEDAIEALDEKFSTTYLKAIITALENISLEEEFDAYYDINPDQNPVELVHDLEDEEELFKQQKAYMYRILLDIQLRKVDELELKIKDLEDTLESEGED